jgi:hypothetical protein
MTCNAERLSDYLDDALAPDARRDIDAHLAACAECRALLAELAVVKETAADLAGDERIPEADLWPVVAGRTRPAQTGHRALSLSWPQAIAAGLALIAALGGAVWIAMRDRGVDAPPRIAEDRRAERAPASSPVGMPNFPDEAYDRAVNDLRESLNQGRNRLDPQTIQVLERNLAAIDQAIDQTRRALEADPANVSLTSYLASVKRRKLDLLRTARDLM